MVVRRILLNNLPALCDFWTRLFGGGRLSRHQTRLAGKRRTSRGFLWGTIAASHFSKARFLKIEPIVASVRMRCTAPLSDIRYLKDRANLRTAIPKARAHVRER